MAMQKNVHQPTQGLHANIIHAVERVQTNRDRGHDWVNDDDESTIAANFYKSVSRRHTRDSNISSDTTQRGDVFEPINVDDGAILGEIARQLSARRTDQQHLCEHDGNTGIERVDTLEGLSSFDDPVFDPNSPSFNLQKWLRMTMKTLKDESFQITEAGVTMKDLNVYGRGAAVKLQSTILSSITAPLRFLWTWHRKMPSKRIIQNCNAVLRSGEMLLVLGRPGSGCSTFLKVMTGQLSGLEIDTNSTIHYSGIPQTQMMKEFRGEVIYNQEVDRHFPHLTVGQTLEHAAALRVPRRRPLGMSRSELIKHLTQVVMAVYGLTHTSNTKVGNDFVRGVSGGERKRVSIAEMALSGSALAAWDNSTRGLDSASALTFAKSLRLSSNIANTTHAVAIYQASEGIYELFDKVIVLYEGRQVFFGPASRAREYFEEMGWICPPRATTSEFVFGVTNANERETRNGCEHKVPRTAQEFESYWQRSADYAVLQAAMRQYEEALSDDKQQLEAFRLDKKDAQGRQRLGKSPYIASIPVQLQMNTIRAIHRIWNDKASTLIPVITNIVFALILGSVFYGTPNATQGFQAKGSVLFLAVLTNALVAVSEISSLFEQRPIVAKHHSYALYYPWTEALAGIIADIPVKFLTAAAFNLAIYFLANLRREPGQFFLYFLISYTVTYVMAAIFRTVAASTKTISQAMTLSGVLILAVVNYTGFTLPVSYMHPWFGWIHWINPLFYAFEVLISNEFHGVNWTCSAIVPAYTPLQGNSWICDAPGAVAGQDFVNGGLYIAAAFQYYYSTVWRNFGILLAFLFGFLFLYMLAVELNSSSASSAEQLIYRRGHIPATVKAPENDDSLDIPKEKNHAFAGSDIVEEKPSNYSSQSRGDIFTWRDVVYDIEIKGEPRRLLNHVSGLAKPGTLTALMGSSGAGKTTLLDVLAQRTTGEITGEMLVNGKNLTPDFQRNTGYVQQQDLHLETATVRESLRFSAMLRQSRTISRQSKYDHVESVIEMLGMQEFADAIVGVLGEGLNVQQRKMLSIGVELAAKPQLLLFLDEPTSGLDSQSAWTIASLLRTLADHGQAIVCTIHQPSAMLFEQFDRLLFLRKGGQTVYFGDIGKHSRTLLDYFARQSARLCSEEENPAEYMLEIVNDPAYDWHEKWKGSAEFQELQNDIDNAHQKALERKVVNDDVARPEFATPFLHQLYEVSRRKWQEYYRTPSYTVSKLALSVASALFIGFSYYQENTTFQGIKNILYSLFLVATIFTSLVEQIQPMFVRQRDLFEVRERPSKVYSWKVFISSNIIVEIPYQVLCGVLTFACFYYPVVGITGSERQGLALLLCIALFVHSSTFAHLTIAALPDAQSAGAVVTVLFSMIILFCGVMQPPSALPGFWIFMYRVSPFTYWIGGMADALMAGKDIVCSEIETSIFHPPAGETCASYLRSFLAHAPGTLQNPHAASDCHYCPLRNTDQVLSTFGIKWSDRWRNFGLLWAYIGFDVLGAVFLYWFFRARKAN